MDINNVWKNVDEQLKNTFTQACYHSWFVGLKPLHIDNNNFVVSAPSLVVANLIKSVYIPQLEEVLASVSGQKFSLLVVAEPPEKTPENDFLKDVKPTPPPRPRTKEETATDIATADLKKSSRTVFDDTMSFDAFVVGSGNEFAHSAALAVADRPATKYNPLFIYGGTGLGKTHLLHAIGQRIQQNHPDWRIIYVTSEKFTNDLIDSLHKKTNRAFRDFYRSMDVLLLDDVQFFVGKERTQEEFFHTFNELKNNMKQMVLTSDRAPRDLNLLVDRLRTRIEGGLLADIQPPDYETRVAILRKKLLSTDFNERVTEEVVDWVANQVKSNIRELEGAVMKIAAYYELSHDDIDLEVANNILQDYFSSIQNQCIDTFDIIKEVEAYFNLHSNVLLSNTRTNNIVHPRQIAMYLCRQLTSLSYPEIGNQFGGRDHSTVVHAVNKIKREMEQNLNVMSSVNNLIENLTNKV